MAVEVDSGPIVVQCKQSAFLCKHIKVTLTIVGAMRSLRLFFSEGESTCGQLVIASPESQYKIFHFYNGGLDKLATILEEWNLCHSGKTQVRSFT